MHMENNLDHKAAGSNFIRTIVVDDIESGRTKEVVTRFPPEPNGYLHIGHAKAICLNFELSDEFGGRTNLRFDDTNPVKEDVEYVEAIKEDIRWLGFEWDGLFFASDYFEEMYSRAVLLIHKNKAYVCDLSVEETRINRGSFTAPGKDSPYRNRSIEENLDLFARMRNGEFKDGAKVLRAKIDMASPNMNMRDPVLYRIIHATHHNTGDEWCIYPLYDYAHPLGDAVEGVTHSLCSSEYEDHRPLYDWVIRECEMDRQPRQYEFARLNLTNTIMSKRLFQKLIEVKAIDGWDDPRVPTIRGLRRRGYTPESLRAFAREIGVSKSNNLMDWKMLEHCIREDLKMTVERRMAVLKPLKVIITNYTEGKSELLEAENNAENPEMGIRQVTFSREIYIEQDDFMEVPAHKYFRIFPGNEVRLKNSYFIKCVDFVKDGQGNITKLHCTYDPETKSGSGFTGRKVKGTIHWVNARDAVPAEFRLYNQLIEDNIDEEEEAVSFLDRINPNSLEMLQGFVESSLHRAAQQEKFQFFRHGYFNVDSKYSRTDHLVFNRIVSLKSSYEVPKG